MAAIANLRIDQGTTFSSNITLAGSDGAAWDLTGHTVEAKMAKGYESTKTRTTMTTAVANPTTGIITCLLYTSPSPRDATLSRMPSSA